MTLQQFLESGINLEGYVVIQGWKTEDNPIVYAEGYRCNIEIPEEIKDRKIAYIFPQLNSLIGWNSHKEVFEAAICIELAEE